MRAAREHDERMHAEWIGAQLVAYAPQKHDAFPKLDKLLIGERPMRRRQTWQEIKAALMVALPPTR